LVQWKPTTADPEEQIFKSNYTFFSNLSSNTLPYHIHNSNTPSYQILNSNTPAYRILLLSSSCQGTRIRPHEADPQESSRVLSAPVLPAQAYR